MAIKSQEKTVAVTNEVSTEKVEKKEKAKKQASAEFNATSLRIKSAI